MFVLFILGLIFALGPMFLGMGVVLFGFLTSKEFWTYVGVIAVFGLYMFVLIPKLDYLGDLKKKGKLDKKSAQLYRVLWSVYLISSLGIVTLFIYKAIQNW